MRMNELLQPVEMIDDSNRAALESCNKWFARTRSTQRGSCAIARLQDALLMGTKLVLRSSKVFVSFDSSWVSHNDPLQPT